MSFSDTFNFGPIIVSQIISSIQFLKLKPAYATNLFPFAKYCIGCKTSSDFFQFLFNCTISSHASISSTLSVLKADFYLIDLYQILFVDCQTLLNHLANKY